jgi:hypothetical protein
MRKAEAIPPKPAPMTTTLPFAFNKIRRSGLKGGNEYQALF